MQGEEDALAQDHAHDGRLGERDAGPFARVGADAAQLTPDRLWAEAERRISAPED